MIVVVWFAYQHFRRQCNYAIIRRTVFCCVARTLHYLYIFGLSNSTRALMGSCICKDQDDCYGKADDDINSTEADDEQFVDSFSDARSVGSEHIQQKKMKRAITIDKLVLETLSAIRTLVDNEQDPPPSMTKLHLLADRELGWLAVVQSMVNVIPMNDPLGLAVITLLLDGCPLPTKETICKLSDIFQLSEPLDVLSMNATKHRNICAVLGCIAEKLAGPSSVALLNDVTLQYLLNNLHEDNHPAVILFALISLEKFAQTSQNKMTINDHLSKSENKNPLLVLQHWFHSDSFMKRQVGFCASWCLDNLFLVKGRPFAYETLNREGLNAMLNSNDVSEYLKISADGLQARCDASSFESVRCTFQMDSGIWYYEVTIVSAGVMQIGWATKDSKFLNHEGYGIGDDEFSVAYDGCRQLIWHNAFSQPHNHECWKPGDVLGSLLDLKNYQIIFYLNGKALKPCTEVFKNAKSRFFAAASFMSFQQCEFNFGQTPFKYPPNAQFQCINDIANLAEEEKIILPRHKKLEKLRLTSVKEGACTLCFDNCANVLLEPCKHSGFCQSCALQLEGCPMCRAEIKSIKCMMDNS